jgi:beta-xylosidase
VLGEDGKLPATLDLPVSRGLTPSLLASDEFERASGQADLPLAWQWNHNPDNDHWSLTDRRGYLRLSTSRIDASLLAARNMLTQRTIGPSCVGTISIDVSALKDGDHAGLCLLQQQYGLVGVQVDGDTKFLVMAKANPQQRGRRAPRTDIHDAPSIVVEKIAFEGDVVFLRAECDFRDRLDKAHFYYSVDGTSWTAIGEELQMRYTLPHFMGYRFGLFTYSTKHPGGHADFDFFRVSSRLKPSESTADNSADQP